jgi:uncharacterized protein (TIGR02118 family)
MAKLIALYRKPSKPAAFDDYYFQTHLPIAMTIPGLRHYEVSTGSVATPQGESPYHMAAILSFDSIGALEQALGSPEGQATAADLANFAGAGVELLVFESKVIRVL